MHFTSEVRASDSSFVQAIWRARSEGTGTFISPAAIHWDMLLMRYRGRATLNLQGPETKATRASLPADAEWLGITFELGTFMPDLPPIRLLDRHDVTLPEATGKSFWLDGSAWEFPTYENADTFVDRLVRTGLLVRDPLVDEAIQDYPLELTPRALQYRFRRATGLTRKTVQQIQRARQAATLLAEGSAILDTAPARLFRPVPPHQLAQALCRTNPCADVAGPSARVVSFFSKTMPQLSGYRTFRTAAGASVRMLNFWRRKCEQSLQRDVDVIGWVHHRTERARR